MGGAHSAPAETTSVTTGPALMDDLSTNAYVKAWQEFDSILTCVFLLLVLWTLLWVMSFVVLNAYVDNTQSLAPRHADICSWNGGPADSVASRPTKQSIGGRCRSKCVASASRSHWRPS